ncbi:MAG: sensor histidine kinase [Crocinitomicaceae bacterium]|nr:sensor histidine kinase [Crocinitomicaceae bacterium]
MNSAYKVQIDIETAIPLGLIINEMVTNFFKHCARDSKGKRSFAISLTNISDNKFVFRFVDSGKGFPKGTSLDNINSLGLELIDSLSDQINAKFRFFNENGANCEILLEL